MSTPYPAMRREVAHDGLKWIPIRDATTGQMQWGPSRDYRTGELKWAHRIHALKISTFFLFIGILCTLYITVTELQSNHPLFMCSSELSSSRSTHKPNNTAVFIVLSIMFSTSISLLTAHYFMITMHIRILTSQWVNECLPPFFDTFIAFIGLLVSLIASIFSPYNPLHYITIFLFIMWAFFLQIFLLPKSNFGLMSSMTSASFTILTAVVKCMPETPWEYIIFYGGFVTYVVLYYVYAKEMYKPTQTSLHVRHDNLSSISSQTSQHNLTLERITSSTQWKFRHLSANTLAFVKPLADKDAGFEIIPSSVYGEELRQELLNSNEPQWDFLREFYYLSRPGLKVGRRQSPAYLLQSSRDLTLPITSHGRVRSNDDRSVSSTSQQFDDVPPSSSASGHQIQKPPSLRALHGSSSKHGEEWKEE